MEYLFNRNKAVVMGYRILYILAVFIGPYMTVKAVWNIADIFNALMAFPVLYNRWSKDYQLNEKLKKCSRCSENT